MCIEKLFYYKVVAIIVILNKISKALLTSLAYNPPFTTHIVLQNQQRAQTVHHEFVVVFLGILV